MDVRPVFLPAALLPEAIPTEPAPREGAAAARAFEALVLADLLRSARAAADALHREERAASEGFRGMAEQRAAEALAGTSPLGLARLIERALAGPPGPSARKPATEGPA